MGITVVARYFIRDEGYRTVIKSISSTEPRDCSQQCSYESSAFQYASFIPKIDLIKDDRKPWDRRKSFNEMCKLNFPLCCAYFVGISSKVSQG